MGASQFEWGAVPKALHRIAQYAEAGELAAETVLATGAREVYHPTKRKITLTKKPVYILAPRYLLEHATKVVRAQAAADYPRDDHRLKEVSLLQNSIWAEEISESENPGSTKKDLERRADDAKYNSRIRGWLELDNGFFFFADKTMYESTCAIFGVTPPDAPTK